uniref:Secreted protein n=1 Tax=Macrostomum lignano TaxID=282301 RepID=A0A1I8F432_9PLAT
CSSGKAHSPIVRQPFCLRQRSCHPHQQTGPTSGNLFLLILVASVLLCLLSANWTSQSIFSYKWQCGEAALTASRTPSAAAAATGQQRRSSASQADSHCVRSWRRLLDVRLNDSSSADRNSSNAANDEFPTDRWHFMHWDDASRSPSSSRSTIRTLFKAYRKLVNGLERFGHRPVWSCCTTVGRSVHRHARCGRLLGDPTPLARSRRSELT